MKNVRKEVFLNCIPAMFCMVISGLNTIIDGLFIGGNIGEDGLAAINIAWPVPAFIISSGIGIGVGSGICYVSSHGKKQEREAKEFLKNLFESKQDYLRNSLQDLQLPKDALKIERAVSEYLNKLFDENGEFRMQLTQSEDYILQSALSLLNAQQAILSEVSMVKEQKAEPKQHTINKNAIQSNGLSKEAVPYSIGASAAGGVIGGVVIGTWGAVFGSIAGTALALYFAANKEKQITKSKLQTVKQATSQPNQKLDVEKFIRIVAGVCESIDNLIETFRAQINRVIDKYEQRPKPTLETNFKSILEGIQSLIGYKLTHDEDLTELLDNYDLEIVEYKGDNVNLFEEISSPTAQHPKMVVPAIVKGGNVVLRGKVFIPEK